MSNESLTAYSWKRYPETAAFLFQRITGFCKRSALIQEFADQLQLKTGTRLLDWVDHLELKWSDALQQQLIELGYVAVKGAKAHLLLHPEGMFPAIQASDSDVERIFVRVESVADFLTIHQCELELPITGEIGSAVRQRVVINENGLELHVIERHGAPISAVLPDADVRLLLKHAEAFQLRKRDFDDDVAGFAEAEILIKAAIDDLGVDRTCDLFFAAERDYWQQRNAVARIQKARQDSMGMGWANHDHHTFRSSRPHFWRLISVLELLGFELRERFYAGREAGWGAQVLEQPAARVVIFADVDLSPEEVSQDFAHEPLPELKQLGTVGLWCRLHGEAFLQAGMHHLECQFDFDAARQQLSEENSVKTMKPFTDLPHLKQAFTAGEIWPVEESRIQSLLEDGLINEEAAERFRLQGAIGSHLEILQREEGFKGFNQTGINEIILETNPLKQQQK
ncbi:hypothetical protein [Gimesia sp.]|uniref:hypothetical protein n=1 Tax=Gimesia sp. TaxID=2024833 RepID=UPI003A8F5A72